MTGSDFEDHDDKTEAYNYKEDMRQQKEDERIERLEAMRQQNPHFDFYWNQ